MSNEIVEIQEVFETIYKEDLWRGGSGPGSHPDNTIEYRAFLARFLEANNISSITDLGCGDWQFSRYVDWSRADYIGLDVASSVIAHNDELYGCEGITFRTLKCLDDLPGGDLCICKDMLQHLPNHMISAHLSAISKRYKFSLYINDVEPEERVNVDIQPGEGRPLRLNQSPFYAKGAVVFSFIAQRRNQFWRKDVFLMFGN